MWRKLTATLMATLTLSMLAAPAAQASAASWWDPGRIVTDEVFFNANSMSQQAVTDKLYELGGNCVSGNGNTCLKDYVQGGKTGAQSIYQAAQKHQINPQVLIVTLQKEQSLVTSAKPPATWNRAMGLGCPDGGWNGKPGTCDPARATFEKQIDGAAQALRTYISKPNSYPNTMGKYHAGQPLTLGTGAGNCPTQQVSVSNQATAALYTYTPHTPNQATIEAFGGSGKFPACAATGYLTFANYMNKWFGVPYPGRSATLERLEGATRIETAVNVSWRAFPNGSSVAYLARHDVLADAQTAATLKDGPVLLIPRSGAIPTVVTNRLRDLNASQVVLLGGTTAISQATENTLKKSFKVSRLQGPTRTETSLRIADRWKSLHGGAAEIYVTGMGTAEGSIDAAVAGVLTQGPILILDGSNSVRQWLQKSVPGVPVRAIGGVNVVSDRTLQNLGAPVNGRLSGEERYQTSAAVARHAVNTGTPTDSLYLATGKSLADSATAGTLTGGPIVLTSDTPTAAVNEYARWQNAATVTAIGGTEAVSKYALETVGRSSVK